MLSKLREAPAHIRHLARIQPLAGSCVVDPGILLDAGGF